MHVHVPDYLNSDGAAGGVGIMDCGTAGAMTGGAVAMAGVLVLRYRYCWWCW